MEKKINIVAMSGSLRKGSFNTMLLKAAVGMVPEGATIEIVEIRDLPLFDADLETALPQTVVDFKAKIKAADGVLFVTPEYNYSIPGGLKNAIDWGSRPYGDNSFEGKPAAIMSASPGMLGGSRAQYHLRQTFVFLNMHAFNRPEIIVPMVSTKFDEHGTLIDQATIDHIKPFLESFVEWVKRFI
jgi:chromate reductase